MVTPQQYAIYKGVTGKFGAVQFNFQAPHKYCTSCKTKDFTGALKECCSGSRVSVREGAVFVDITSAKDKNVYDWDNKITVALSVNDLGKVVYFLKTGRDPREGKAELKLMHDPGAASAAKGKVQKHILFASPNGIASGFMLNVTQVSGQDKRSHNVPVSGDETMVLATLLQTAISKALAWG